MEREVDEFAGAVLGDAVLDRRLRDELHYPVKEPRTSLLGKSFAVVACTHTHYHFRASLPPRDKRGDELGRMLEIRIYHEYAIARCLGNAGGRRHFFPEMAAEFDVFAPPVPCSAEATQGKGLYSFCALIRTAVVDEDELTLVRGKLPPHMIERVVDERDVLLLVVERDYDRN